MKKRIHLLILTLGIISCSSDDETKNNDYEFIVEYSTTVTVGGVVGVTERTFEIGEVYTGTDQGDDTITIRIAEHSELNDDCPNRWCYQELLNVPREFLKLVE
ncbi:hypothetical protein Q4Q34_01385 [Flavivirga abyssicola]|uniref:hypothetical protein n=1 Tax=Flavivirga abyssicola TaxID=3063533 RepID=UPI0026E09D8D|nr:hypothetical protein [Flavivirga sp. MEBiC07777]WVK13691.1 hypothetical protein Q4Q34_01385 [Flavivirga sp. MEBiC07777]